MIAPTRKSKDINPSSTGIPMAVATASLPGLIVYERTPAYRIQEQTGAFNRSVRREAELWAELFTDPAILPAFHLRPARAGLRRTGRPRFCAA